MQLFAFCSTAMRMTSWYKHQLSVQQNKTKQEKIYEKKNKKKVFEGAEKKECFL
jgi:hypothetical protein